MENNAVISIVSNASMEDGDLIEVVSPGTFVKNGDSYKAIYEETEISGMEGTLTTLEIEKNKVVLLREGTTSAKMIFDLKEPMVSLYSTPYGALQITTLTKKLDVDMDELGGKLNIEYEISIGGEKPQKTALTMEVKTN